MQDLRFEEIYDQFRKPIFRLCLGYVNDDEKAKDLCQETFIAVFQRLPKFRGESAVGTWVYRIASNICLRQINIEKRMPKSDLPASLKDDDLLHEKIRKDKLTDFLYQCISELPETERIIISMNWKISSSWKLQKPSGFLPQMFV